MIKIKCPHCGATGSITPPPKEFIIIAPCPQCGEGVVLYQGEVVAVNREILKNGTREQKVQHVAEIITAFIESVGALPPALFGGEEGSISSFPEIEQKVEFEALSDEEIDSFTKEEIRDFINIDLKLIDNREYFEQLFGKLE
jgi:hypothetical protein